MIKFKESSDNFCDDRISSERDKFTNVKSRFRKIKKFKQTFSYFFIKMYPPIICTNTKYFNVLF